MQNHKEYGRLYSASDLVSYLGCHHRTELDLKKLNGWEGKPVESDASAKLIQDYGDRHERAYLDYLKNQEELKIVEINKKAPLDEQLRLTKEAMTSGVDVIFQATLLQPPFIGYADFFIKVPGKSKFGDYQYEVVDTKLAKSSRGKFVIQLCLYAEMLAVEQGVMPESLHIVLGRLDPREAELKGLITDAPNIKKLRTLDYLDYFRSIREHYLSFIKSLESKQSDFSTYPEPVKACGLCRWAEYCEDQWETNDHLSRVANIRKDQIKKLGIIDITKMKQLSELKRSVPGISQPVLNRLQKQAELQINPTNDGKTFRIEYLEPEVDLVQGLALLPKPAIGDLYFDMEGFPYEVGGLEYLFGLGWVSLNNPNQFEFKPFWAHDRAAEKKAFEEFMDFVKAHLTKYPYAHIYHYAPYEKTAIKRLSSMHNTRTAFRDQLLRDGKLVDLYRVVRSGLQLALPSYSIKYVEKYYRGVREGEVVNAGDSIVMYEDFRTVDDEEKKIKILDSIQKYNHDDVESTWQLHCWLERQKQERLIVDYISNVRVEENPSQAIVDREVLVQNVLNQINEWSIQQPESLREKAKNVSELLEQIIDFYWRCKLPSLWRKFQREEDPDHDPLEDMDCLGFLDFTGETQSEKSSLRYFYKVPDQESKLTTGSIVKLIQEQGSTANFEYDLEKGIASFTRNKKSPAPSRFISLGLGDAPPTDVQQESIYRFVKKLHDYPNQTNAVLDILMVNTPNLLGYFDGQPIVAAPTTEELIAAVEKMNNTYLVIQGPPGTGKSTNASMAISKLIKGGKKVAITSNSHAAINHLLKSSVKMMKLEGVSATVAVVKEDESLPDEVMFIKSNEINSEEHQLVGGTSWLFSREDQMDKWDYLFVDEASQVSLADLIASGSCAKNIVLLGDQMQLPQPIEGIHPGKSGLSVLDYLMGDHPTVPKEMGIFLEKTYRMHPSICKPISDGVYESRLNSVESCEQQKLVIRPDADKALKKVCGISYIEVAHQGRSQSSEEESKRIKEIYQSLLKQSWIDREGKEHKITNNDILVVAPYNAQIRQLKKDLGNDARIGTVDKFQGQEAAVAIYSMTSSDKESIPRGLDFLFSKNRLNVGVSRAKCLAIIVASPELGKIECDKVEDMALLNFYIKLISKNSI